MPCPSWEELARLGFEPFDDGRFHLLEQHIESCAPCQEVLERLARGESHCVGREEVDHGASDLPVVPGFVLEKELGRGGMGVVYRAWQTRLMRRVAIKLVSVGAAATSEARERVLHEARSLSRVRDPRVVTLYDVGEQSGMLYLVLEYVPGGSLRTRLQGPLTPGVSARLVEQIAGATAAVHRAGLLHLDLKPSNILLDSAPGATWEEASPRVADFGIARLGETPEPSQSLFGGPWGTPSYMAPEQLEPGTPEVGPRTDIYALGAILYELLTGRPPFQAASVLETLEQVRDQDPVPPRRINSSLPRDLETICLRCLRKSPGQRYATPEDLAADLGRWREGLPIQARPLDPARRVWRLARRHPLPVGLGLTLALTLFSGVLGMLFLWQRAETERHLMRRSRDHARANYMVAAHSLREIAAVAAAALSDPATAYPVPDYLESALTTARAEQLTLARENSLPLHSREEFAMIDSLLGEIYQLRNRQAEAIYLFDEALDLWEARISEGTDPDLACAFQLRCIYGLGRLQALSQSGPALQRWGERINALTPFLLRSPRHTGESLSLSEQELAVADSLAFESRTELARGVLENSLHRAETLVRSGQSGLELSLCRTLALSALGEDHPAPEGSRSSQPRAKPGSPEQRMLINAAAEVSARRFGMMLPGVVSRTPVDENVQIWAEHLAEFARQQCERFGLDDAAVPTVAWRMRDIVSGMATNQRTTGRLDEANLTARRMEALAAVLTRCYPQRSEPLMIQSEALIQEAKNAWRRNDRAAVLQATEESQEAAVRAIMIDPASEEAHHLVVDRHRRLERLASSLSTAP